MLFNQICKAILLPPGCILSLAVVGCVLRRFRPRIGTAALVGSWVLLATLSMPACGDLLSGRLERAAPLDPSKPFPQADAIVVLSADVYPSAPEYGEDTIGLATLLRLRYGAWLHRKTGLPLLVTGGRLQPGYRPLGDMMAETLSNEFGIEARWIERDSRNTAGNARGSAKLLHRDGIRRILLVTSATHIPRARAIFEQQGLEVIPAPTGITSSSRWSIGDFVPRSSALQETTLALHEWIGRVWYWVAE